MATNGPAAIFSLLQITDYTPKKVKTATGTMWRSTRVVQKAGCCFTRVVQTSPLRPWWPAPRSSGSSSILTMGVWGGGSWPSTRSSTGGSSKVGPEPLHRPPTPTFTLPHQAQAHTEETSQSCGPSPESIRTLGRLINWIVHKF